MSSGPTRFSTALPSVFSAARTQVSGATRAPPNPAATQASRPASLRVIANPLGKRPVHLGSAATWLDHATHERSEERKVIPRYAHAARVSRSRAPGNALSAAADRVRRL